MPVYLVTWKLKPDKPDRDAALAGLVERIEAYHYIHDEDFESVYVIATDRTAGQVNEDLHQGLENDDKLIVARLTDEAYCGWMPQPVWDWIAERI